MSTKYRCPRCLETFEDPYEADQHEHEGDPEADPVREIEAADVEIEQTTFREWDERAFRRAGERE